MESFYSVVFNCIGFIIIAIGIVCVYDARKLVKKFFSTSDINGATKTIKVVGFIVSLIGAFIVIV